MEANMQELVILIIASVIAGVLVIFLADWLKKIHNRGKFFAFIGEVLAKNLRWLKKPAVVILFSMVFVAGLIYIFWLQDKLFPETRLKVAVCTFSHNVKDNDAIGAWTEISRRIQEGLAELKDEIKLELLDTMVRGEDTSRLIGEANESDLVVWGNIVHIEHDWEIEPRVTLLGSLVSFKPIISAPTKERFSMNQSISQPGVIDLARKKGQEVNDAIFLVSGLANYKSGAFMRAINLFEKINPQSATVLILMGNAYLEDFPPNYGKAEKLYREATILAPDSAKAYSNWGVALVSLGRNEEAIEKYKKATELKPDLAEAYSNWGAALVNLGRNEGAIEKFKKAIELKPDYANAYYNWGVASGELGRDEDAIENYKKAIGLKSDLAEAYSNWGVALVSLDRNEEAIEKFKKATELKPDDSEAYYNWGVALGNLDSNEEAIEKFKKAIVLKPDFAEAYSNWGMALLNLDSNEEAIEKFKKATVLKPNFAEVYSNWGVALGELGRYEEAIEKCKKATDLKPNYASGWYNTACIHSLQKNKAEALKNLKKAIELDPS
jgi:tetratricopeptide (TPR) repeat protein